MKRSSAISLAIVGALAMSGCSPSPQADEPTTYRNVTECVQDGKSQATCEKSFADAKAEAEKTAPKFASQAECAAQFGNCQQSASGGWFMPALMGYMVGNMMSNNGGTRYVSQPVYIDRSGRDVTSSYSNGTYRTTPSAPTYTQRASARAAAASTGSRGGFGSTARSSSSYGG